MSTLTGVSRYHHDDGRQHRPTVSSYPRPLPMEGPHDHQPERVSHRMELTYEVTATDRS